MVSADSVLNSNLSSSGNKKFSTVESDDDLNSNTDIDGENDDEIDSDGSSSYEHDDRHRDDTKSSVHVTPDADVETVADNAAAAILGQQQLLHAKLRPPNPLPVAWVLKESRTNPNYYYYFNYETGECTWDPPFLVTQNQDATSIADAVAAAYALAAENVANAAAAAASVSTNQSMIKSGYEDGTSPKPKKHSNKRPADDDADDDNMPSSPTSLKRIKTESTSSKKPSKVRILHILKKHKDARRPSSWRRSQITITKEEAIEELQGLIDVLQEVDASNDKDELRATFEELARTESDCNSAKRGGDLGYFGPKKMQPTFEDASFRLQINEMSGIVETSSGVHVLLRIG